MTHELVLTDAPDRIHAQSRYAKALALQRRHGVEDGGMLGAWVTM